MSELFNLVRDVGGIGSEPTVGFLAVPSLECSGCLSQVPRDAFSHVLDAPGSAVAVPGIGTSI